MIKSTYCYIQLIIENIISWCAVFGTNYLFISYFAFFFFKFINLFVSDVVFLYLRDEIIQKDLLKEIKDAQFHLIMIDEASSFNKEIISLCFRFVDKDNNIREEFLDFIDTERTDGKTLF